MWGQRIKTLLLLTVLSGLFLLLGHWLGGLFGLQVAFIIALVMNGVAYFFSDTFVLRMYKAQPLDRKQYASIYDTVQELTHTMGIPVPKLWLVDSPIANAFATGRSPEHASVALTSGILAILDQDELRGVLAHELAHIKHRDILVTTIAATIATAIGYVAHMLQNMALWGSVNNGQRRAAASSPVVMLLIGIIMPIAATIVQLAISRSREYLADEGGADCSRDPLSLASALEKLHNHTRHVSMHADDMHKASTASLFIVHPFTSEGLVSLFSTHPPMHKRIARLRAMRGL